MTVRVENNEGLAATQTGSVSVQENAPSLNVLTLAPVKEGDKVDLSTISFDESDPFDRHSATIAWGDGTTDVGSLLLAMLMHAAINNTKDIVPSATPGAADALAFHASPVAWLTVGLLWLAASIFLVRLHQLSGIR